MKELPLLPPHPTWSIERRPQFTAEVLHVSPPFVMSMSSLARYVHRPRSGHRFPSQEAWHMRGRESYEAWCGQMLIDAMATDDPGLLPVCATCEGRAVGAGWPTAEQVILGEGEEYWPKIQFTPRPDFDPPRVCPASGEEGGARRFYVDDPTNWRIGHCLMCGRTVALRGGGGWMRPWWGPARHEPHEMVAPCLRHAWMRMARVDDPEPRVVCLCTLDPAPIPVVPRPSYPPDPWTPRFIPPPEHWDWGDDGVPQQPTITVLRPDDPDPIVRLRWHAKHPEETATWT